MPPTVPDAPEEFFTRFFVEQYAASRRFPRSPTAAKAAFDVVGVGAWSFSVAAEALRVENGIAPDTALRVSVEREDFERLFVRRTRREIDRTGRIPDDLLSALKPLFVDEKKRRLAEGARGSLRIELREDGDRFALTITPGSAAPTEPRATVVMRLSDFFALVRGKAGVTKLLLTGRLKVRGDKAHALALAGLVG